MQNIEYQNQVALFEWANIESKKIPCLALLNASMNGVKLLNIKAGARAKRAGMKKGYPDIFLPVARGEYFGLFIELKRQKTLNSSKGILTAEQKWWLDSLNSQGYRAVVCYGFYEARDVILEYLGYGTGAR